MSTDPQHSAPRISILMTVYNTERYLRYSIDSILCQSFADWELIVVDDGSTDGSRVILEGYGDPRIRKVLLSQNIGRTPALRRAFELARAEYIAVLDADDVAHPQRLQRQIVFLDQRADVGMVGSYTQYIDEFGKVFAEFRPPTSRDAIIDSLGWTNPITHSAAMYRRQLASDVGGYSTELSYAQDFGLTLAIAQKSGLGVIDEFLCQLRVLPTSMSRSRKYRLVVAREGLLLFKRAGEFFKLSKKARRLNRRIQAIYQIKLGIATLGIGSLMEGLKMIVRGLRSDPSALWINGPIRRLLNLRDPVIAKVVVNSD